MGLTVRDLLEKHGGGTWKGKKSKGAIPGGVSMGVIPELTINAGVQVNSWMRAFIGYNLLYVDNVVRPANHIDGSANSTGIPFLGANGANPPGAVHVKHAFLRHQLRSPNESNTWPTTARKHARWA